MYENLKPSNFTILPMNSIFNKYEYELMAQNIMKILKRTGDKFRKIELDEYIAERKKDGGYSSQENEYFLKVVDLCSVPEGVISFSPVWKEIANLVKPA